MAVRDICNNLYRTHHIYQIVKRETDVFLLARQFKSYWFMLGGVPEINFVNTCTILYKSFFKMFVNLNDVIVLLVYFNFKRYRT